MTAGSTGMIGLGLLGSAMAERLLERQGPVIGYDRSNERNDMLGRIGVQVAESPREVFQQCDVTFFSLPTSDVVEQLLGDFGDELRPGTYVIDTTTGEPEQTAAFGAMLAARGIHYLDATVAGSSAQARAGEVVVLVGGESEAFAVCQGHLKTFASQVLHVGPHGSGAKFKLVHNLILGLHRAVLAEGLHLAKGLGLELSPVLKILRVTPAYSTVMETKGPKMIADDFSPPQATMTQHHKDVKLMLAAAERAGIQLPLTTLHDQLLETAERAGWGELDNSAVWRVFTETPASER